ncbi:MAG: hypothetical protein AB8U25_02990 [Rickettsiales endosymbiont of Dermacentor nuttalli]
MPKPDNDDCKDYCGHHNIDVTVKVSIQGAHTEMYDSSHNL